MTLATRTVTLPGGLQATLVHQPQADRAAALARVAAGSHHEPSRFPGLAHLLEHLLFYGGERYRDDDRLMGWVQRQGGSVNATTLARHSAFFFEVAAGDLADGVARLQEMLQAPRLLREDIQREVAVIDAEYRLIQQHEPSRREAAVRHAAKYTNNVEFSAEDASRSNPDFLVRVFTEVINAGATTINVPDTVGYAQPDEYGKLIKYVIENTPNSHKAVFSVHCHDDLGLAVANSLSAIQNGARQAEVTLCGIGERAGNASLEEIVMAMKVRPDVYGVDCGIQNEQLYPACRLLSLIIGRPIAANKAIVGSNAFAHESGIHQDGMLKNRETYEIMTPQSIGRKSTDLVIGKHSGRNAVRTRLEELGYRLDDEQVNVVFAAVKDLADKKANVHDEDLEALVFSEVYRLPDRYRLGNVSVQTTMGSSMPATAAVVIQAGEEEMRRAGFGAGPIDATFNVISQIVSRAPDLEQFSINAITGGTDAQGEVTVRLREGEYSATGRGSDPDIIVASAKAYIDALNRLDHKERDAIRTQEATGEPAINTCN